MNPAAARHPSAGKPRASAGPRSKSSPAKRPAARPHRLETPEINPETNSGSPAQHLRVAPKPPRKFRKLFMTGMILGLLGLVAIPFGIVFLHANLLAGQRDLDHMRQDLNEQLELRQQLLFERSLAVSPQRIITIARDQLGMVPAENIVYLQSAQPPNTDLPTDSTAPSSQPTP